MGATDEGPRLMPFGGERVRFVMSGPGARKLLAEKAYGRWELANAEPLLAVTGVPHTPTANPLTTTYSLFDIGVTEGIDPQSAWTFTGGGFILYGGIFPTALVGVDLVLTVSRGAGGATDTILWRWASRTDGTAPTAADVFGPEHSQLVSSNADVTLPMSTLLLMSNGDTLALMMKLGSGTRTYNSQAATLSLTAEG